MMLHRHFEAEKNKNITELKDVTPTVAEEEYVSDVFPPDEAPKRRGRPKKQD